jgi:hypothetical protein
MPTPSDSGISVTTPGVEKMFALELLDSSFRRIERAFGELHRSVPPGLYLVRCDMGGRLAERYAKVREGHLTEVSFTDQEVSLLPSAAPVPGSEACHEYYVYPAIKVSTQPRQTLGHGARLVIFASRLGNIPELGATANETIHLGGLELRDQDLALVTALPGNEVLAADDIAVGRAAWSIELNPGGYLLEWPADDLGLGYRTLEPVWLAENWTTLLFANAPRTGGLPDRRSLSIQMCRGAFDPYNNPGTTAAELALASLRSNRRQLSDQHLSRLLHGKFENPMLGLLGAHMLLERRQPNGELVAEIISNLGKLLGPHPDVTSLAIIARRRHGIDLPDLRDVTATPHFPPMFRAGLEAIINAEWEESRPMQIGRLDSLARFHLSPDEPWTFFWRSDRTADMTTRLWIESAGEAATRLARQWPTFSTSVWDAIAPLRDSAADYVASLLKSPTAEGSTAAAENENSLGPRLRSFAQQLLEQKGPHVLRQLKPEHLRWTGLSPEQAGAAVEEIQSWGVKLFVTEANEREKQGETSS